MSLNDHLQYMERYVDEAGNIVRAAEVSVSEGTWAFTDLECKNKDVFSYLLLFKLNNGDGRQAIRMKEEQDSFQVKDGYYMVYIDAVTIRYMSPDDFDCKYSRYVEGSASRN